MKILKKILIIILAVMAFIFATCEPVEPKGDVNMIAPRVCAKGKPKRVKKKTIKSDYESLGEYVLTAYCSCSKCCGKYSSGKTASGVKAKANHTIAADKSIPFKTKLVINGIIYEVEDRGSGVRGKHIDIFFDNHSEAVKFGKQKAEVYKKKPPVIISKLKEIKKGVMSFASSTRS